MKALLTACLLWFATLTASANITFSPPSITITAEPGASLATRDVVVSVESNNASWSANDSSPWFEAYPAVGSDGAVIHITFPFSTSGYPAGTYQQPIYFTATGNPAARLMVTLILTGTPPIGDPPVIQIAPSSVNLYWMNPSTPTRTEIFDCRRDCTPPIYAGAVLIRTVSSTPNIQQTVRLPSSLAGTKLIPGTHHIYLLKAIDSRGFESVFSNPAPYDIPFVSN